VLGYNTIEHDRTGVIGKGNGKEIRGILAKGIKKEHPQGML